MAFLRNVLATITGLILFFGLMFLLFAGIAAALSSDEVVEVKENSVLRLNLSGNITEIAPEESFEELLLGEKAMSHGLINMLTSLKAAANDAKIKGAYLYFGGLNATPAMLDELREAIAAFKSKGKFVYAFADIYAETDYFVASVADKVFLHPEGMIEFNGLGANVMFFKGTFEKLGIKPEIFRVGEYKSAIEPFIRKDLSEENREQNLSLMTSIQEQFMSVVSKNRGVAVDRLNEIAEQMLVKFPDEAVKHKLVDEAVYVDQVEDKIREAIGLGAEEKIPFISYKKYEKSITDDYSKNKIAVVVAEGTIVGGEGNDGQIGADSFVKELRKVRQDDKIKAVIVRINSPGGSALASDIIWRELELLKAKKPLIASMSGVAASGGYYMAAAADTIIASETTITGSIGVFGIMANIGEFMENKLGITFDQVKTNEYADFPNLTRPFSSTERAFIQSGVDRVYDTFLDKVDQGRPIDRAAVEKVARGRVWSGNQALERGLVDQLGGLELALSVAADKAALGVDYMIRIYPEPKDIFEQFFEGLDGGVASTLINREFGAIAPYTRQLKEIQHYTGIQARMPFEITIE